MPSLSGLTPEQIIDSLQNEFHEQCIPDISVNALLLSLQQNIQLPLADAQIGDLVVRYMPDGFAPSGTSIDFGRVRERNADQIICEWNADVPNRSASFDLITGISSTSLSIGWVNRAFLTVPTETI